MKKLFILILVLVAAALSLSACSKATEASVKEVSVAEIKEDKAKQMIEMLAAKDGAHIFMGEKDFYLFLNASNAAQDSKPVEFGGLKASYDKNTKALVLDYVEKEAVNKENIKNKVIYKIPISEKPEHLKLLKNGKPTPVTTLGS